jgi:hypothetical protein
VSRLRPSLRRPPRYCDRELKAKRKAIQAQRANGLRLRLQTFNQGCFAEYFIPLVEPSPSIPAERNKDLAVAFVFDHATLWRLAGSTTGSLTGRVKQ